MSKTKRSGANSKPRKTATGDYPIGYCRPPEHTQFKPGQSGYPKGRKKGSKNETTIWREVLSKRISIREGGKTRKVSVLEAMILKYIERALSDDVKSATFVLNRIRLIDGNTPDETEGLDHDDQAVYESLVRRIEANIRSKKG